MQIGHREIFAVICHHSTAIFQAYSRNDLNLRRNHYQLLYSLSQ
jgi:hypothetical protein